MDTLNPLLKLAEKTASQYSLLSQVEAVVWAGSQTFVTSDSNSDIDLYIYLSSPLPVEVRAEIANKNAIRAEVDNRFWEDGDEWVDAGTNILVDVMFRQTGWIEEQLNRVLLDHQASVGYSTCFWHNVLSSRILFDRNSWFEKIQQQAGKPYPKELQQSIIAKNYPILKQNLSSFFHQLELAVARQDLVSINHRVAALLASYFDILFAVNCLPHPGEKRLVEIAETRCVKRPAEMREKIERIISSISVDHRLLLGQINELIDDLTKLLKSEDLLSSAK